MKIILALLCFCVAACKAPGPIAATDIIDTLILVHRSSELSDLLKVLGTPVKVESMEDPSLKRYVFESDQSVVEALVDVSAKRVMTSSTMFWKSDDDYALLRRRFAGHAWVEEFVPTSPHPIQELYQVRIPDLGISFEYDKLAPKIMWIYFSKPEER